MVHGNLAEGISCHTMQGIISDGRERREGGGGGEEGEGERREGGEGEEGEEGGREGGREEGGRNKRRDKELNKENLRTAGVFTVNRRQSVILHFLAC